MSTVPAWNTVAFGCMVRDQTSIASMMRTTLTASLPQPFVTRKADVSAPLDMGFGIDVDHGGFAAWQQWVLYDLADGVLPFTFYLPWGTKQPRVRGRLLQWSAQHGSDNRWRVSGRIEIERESLPRFSGGAYA